MRKQLRKSEDVWSKESDASEYSEKAMESCFPFGIMFQTEKVCGVSDKMKNIERPPLLSVIIPVYQAAPWLKRCVESVLLQTFQNMEIILVDDGSTDGSMEICDLYGKLDQRVHVIHQENRGLAGARTAGICRATGDYVTYVDADDWMKERDMKKWQKRLYGHRAMSFLHIYHQTQKK